MINLSITKLSALNDCLHLLEASNEICEAFKEASRDERTFAFMADSVGLDERLDGELLAVCHSDWNGALDDESRILLKEKLALAIGSIGYRGLGRQEGLLAEGEEALYRDAYLFRVYYVDKGKPSATAVRTIFKAMRQRNMIELHTFVPYMPAIDKWFDRMNDWDLYVEMDRNAFAEAVEDTARLEQHVSEARFYDPDEAILQLLVRLRKGERIEGEEVNAVLQNEAHSLYAQAVLSGFAELLKASGVFTGTTNNVA